MAFPNRLQRTVLELGGIALTYSWIVTPRVQYGERGEKYSAGSSSVLADSVDVAEFAGRALLLTLLLVGCVVYCSDRFEQSIRRRLRESAPATHPEDHRFAMLAVPSIVFLGILVAGREAAVTFFRAVALSIASLSVLSLFSALRTPAPPERD